MEAAAARTTKVGAALGMADVEVEAVVGGLEARLAAVARAVEAVTPTVDAPTTAPTAAPTAASMAAPMAAPMAARRPRLLGLESVCPSGCNRI